MEPVSGTMNVELLRKVQDKLRELDRSPKTRKLFDMRHWDLKIGCGTSHCIGGWGSAISGFPDYGNDPLTPARRFGLDDEQVDRLFYVIHWPRRFQGKKDYRKPTIAQAIARIDHFIETNGAE